MDSQNFQIRSNKMNHEKQNRLHYLIYCGENNLKPFLASSLAAWVRYIKN